MTLNKYLLCFIVGLTFSHGTLLAQESNHQYRATKLDNYLREHTDTTLVFQVHDIVWGAPIYYLSKKDDMVTLFRYGLHLRRHIQMPGKIWKDIRDTLKDSGYKSTEVDLNRFFNAVDVPRDEIQLLWKNIMALKPQDMVDDIQGKAGCGPDKPGINLMDGGDTKFTILTKDSIKYFYFYSPRFFEEHCPGNSGRKTIISIEKLIGQYGKFDVF